MRAVILRCDDATRFNSRHRCGPIRRIMKLGKIGLGCALGIIGFAGSADAGVTAVYGCRFYQDGKVYAEFRINEIDFTRWDDEGFFDPPTGKPLKTEVETKGVPGEDEGLVFRLPKEDVEIVVANTLDFVNARYSGPEEKNLPGECEQADTKNALDRWFLERQQQHKRKPR